MILFLGYAVIVFRPGAQPPRHPQNPPAAARVPGSWSGAQYQLYIAEARRDTDQQQADKRDIRTRAQVVLTTTFVLGTAIAASYTAQEQHPGLGGKIVFVLAGLLTALAGLAAGGIITARSAIGAPNLQNLLATSGEKLERRLAEEYAATRFVGAATVAVLVTVLRDSVLVLILAFVTFVCAYIWA
jgi:hypothetical protein